MIHISAHSARASAAFDGELMAILPTQDDFLQTDLPNAARFPFGTPCPDWLSCSAEQSHGLCQAVNMAKKRTKADRLQRQIEQLDRKVDRRPDEIEKKKTTREDGDQAAAQTVREVSEGR